jgi:hypothetical protein
MVTERQAIQALWQAVFQSTAALHPKPALEAAAAAPL